MRENYHLQKSQVSRSPPACLPTSLSSAPDSGGLSPGWALLCCLSVSPQAQSLFHLKASPPAAGHGSECQTHTWYLEREQRVVPWQCQTGCCHRDSQSRSVGGRGEGSGWREMRQGTEADVRWKKLCTGATRQGQRLTPGDHGMLQCDPQDGACIGQRAHSNIGDRLRSTFVRFGSVTWEGWRAAGSSEHLTPVAWVCRYHTHMVVWQ